MHNCPHDSAAKSVNELPLNEVEVLIKFDGMFSFIEERNLCVHDVVCLCVFHTLLINTISQEGKL